MPTAGLIGGIAPESTVAYYRKIVAGCRERTGDPPSLIINSIDMPRMLAFVAARDFDHLVAYLLGEVRRLADAGCDFAAFASNTPHIVFEQMSSQSPIPLLSLVEATARAAAALGLRRVGLLGTRFTMEGNFYPAVFSRYGIEIVRPETVDLDYVHEKYMSELVNARFHDATRADLLRIVGRLHQEQGVDGVILGGTELPLILDTAVETAVPLLDTTEIHVREIVSALL